MTINWLGKIELDQERAVELLFSVGMDFKIIMLNFKVTRYLEIVWWRIWTPNSEHYVASVYHSFDPIYDECELLDVMLNSCDQILHDDPNAKFIIAVDINLLDIREFVANSLPRNRVVQDINTKLRALCRQCLSFCWSDIWCMWVARLHV